MLASQQYGTAEKTFKQSVGSCMSKATQNQLVMLTATILGLMWLAMDIIMAALPGHCELRETYNKG